MAARFEDDEDTFSIIVSYDQNTNDDLFCRKFLRETQRRVQQSDQNTHAFSPNNFVHSSSSPCYCLGLKVMLDRISASTWTSCHFTTGPTCKDNVSFIEGAPLS